MTVIIQGSELLAYLAEREGRTMERDVDLRLWSEWPATIRDPEAEIAAMRERNLRRRPFVRPWTRDAVPWPWRIPDLIGSMWGNVYTGAVETIDRVGHDRWHPELPLACRHNGFGYSRDQAVDNEIQSIGMWYDGRYYVDCWLRLDHLAPVVRYRWMVDVRIPTLERDIADQRRQVREHDRQRDSCYGVNHRELLREIGRREEDLREAIAQAEAIAGEAGVAFWEREVHNRRLVTAGRTAQARLL